MPDSTRDLLIAYLKEPGQPAYMALRQALAASPAYDPYGDDLRKINDLLDRGEFRAALDAARGQMANCLLTPRVHLLAAFASSKIGDVEGEQMELHLGRALLDGILGTGDGSRERPYLVTRIADEYDVLGALGKELKVQNLVQEDGRHFDRLECTDGAELWFDIGMQMARLQHLNGGGGQGQQGGPGERRRPWWRFGR